jgi:hypothetical protein
MKGKHVGKFKSSLRKHKTADEKKERGEGRGERYQKEVITQKMEN